MIKKSFNFLFWGGIIAFCAFNVSKHFDSFEIASSQFQQEKYEEADVAISKYNASSHRTIKTVNGYVLQSEISNQLDRFYLGKELASHALSVAQKDNNKKGICISQNALQQSKMLIGDFKDVEKPLHDCLIYFKNEQNDFDTIKTLKNIAHFHLMTNNKNFISTFNDIYSISQKKESLEYLLVDLYVDKMFYHLKRNEPLIAQEMIEKSITLHKKHFSQQLNKLAYLQILSVAPNIGSDKNLDSLELMHKIMDDKNLKFNITMKIHTLLIMGQVYKNLEDIPTSLKFDLKALELFNTFPIKEIHAIEGAMIYKQLLLDYSKLNDKENFTKTKKEADNLLKNFPIAQQMMN